jgi:uncharacterized protein YqcC (DUF446 family)
LCSASVPSPEALASTAPFCVDSLSFPQWLQFIFIPGLRRIIDQRQLLPRECQVAPMAEMYFRLGSSDGAAVVALLQRIDRLLSSPPLDR